jgi:hypothetical protein
MQPEAAVANNDTEIASALELVIRKRTWDRVRDLRVEWTGESVVVHGSTQTYYLKQLALEAAHSTLGGSRPLIIDIAVTYTRG